MAKEQERVFESSPLGRRAEVANKVIGSLRQIIRAVDLHSKYLTKYMGLTGPQLLLMRYIEASPSIIQSELAELSSLSRATVSDILERLEEKGLIHRVRTKSDKRRVEVVISDKGATLLKRNPLLLQSEFLREFGKLEEFEQHQLLSSLQRVASMLLAAAIPPEPLLESTTLNEQTLEALQSITTR